MTRLSAGLLLLLSAAPAAAAQVQKIPGTSWCAIDPPGDWLVEKGKDSVAWVPFGSPKEGKRDRIAARRTPCDTGGKNACAYVSDWPEARQRGAVFEAELYEMPSYRISCTPDPCPSAVCRGEHLLVQLPPKKVDDPSECIDLSIVPEKSLRPLAVFTKAFRYMTQHAAPCDEIRELLPKKKRKRSRSRSPRSKRRPRRKAAPPPPKPKAPEPVKLPELLPLPDE